MLDSSETAKIT